MSLLVVGVDKKPQNVNDMVVIVDCRYQSEMALDVENGNRLARFYHDLIGRRQYLSQVD
jgi:hypothetical protein